VHRCIHKHRARSKADNRHLRTASCWRTNSCPAILSARSKRSSSITTISAIKRASTTSRLQMPTSAGHKLSFNNAKGSNDRLTKIGACKTASSPLNNNLTDEANTPLDYAAISAKCSDHGQAAFLTAKVSRVSDSGPILLRNDVT
jgi:hypothetical protein